MSLWWLWPIAGFLSAIWMHFVFRSKEGPTKQITLGDLLSSIGMTLLAMVFGPVAVVMAIAFTWDEFKLSEIVLWERKPLDLKKEAKKRGYELKPLKGMDD
jgi:hypothetical protein